MALVEHLHPGLPQQIHEHVIRIVAPNGSVMTGAGTNTYVVGTDDVVVIDPGPEDESHMQAILKATAGKRVHWILCTHTHVDHAPGASRLRELSGVGVAAMTAPATDHDFPLRLDKVLMPEEMIGFGGLALRAVHTPGHASNHVCFLLSSNAMLFTGDHIMQGSTVVIWPPDGDMGAYLASLHRLLDLDIRTLAPGHGYLIQSPHAEVERLIRHRLRREDKVRQSVLDAGARGATLETLLPSAYDDVPSVLHQMAARSLQAHLNKLVQDGELRCVGRNYFGS